VSIVHSGWVLGLRPPAGARTLCYSAGLPHQLYGQTDDFLTEHPRALWPLLRRALPRFRASYRGLMRRPDRLVVNSHYSAELVERELGRKVEVVYPPVRTSYFTPAKEPAPAGPDACFVLVARLVRQKRADIAVEAFRGLSQRLVVVGDGPDAEGLRRMAPPNVSFPGPLDDAPLRELYRASSGYVCTSRESFGIAVCEGLASGLPAIAPNLGGPTETVRHGETGLLLDRVEPRTVAEAVRRVAAREFDPAACRASAERFSEERFQREMGAIVCEELTGYSSTNISKPMSGSVVS
jgi:glycosyltransferase involved in cell wall biosynthesis